MIVIPAIDLKDGRCVRLAQGRMDQESVYSENPVQMARHWESKGAERLHVVDLNGAVTGSPVHRTMVEEIARSVQIPVEVGGGIRDLETAETYLRSGVEWVILGTAALDNPALMEDACERFPGRVILGLDARAGRVAIQGWTESVSLKAEQVVRRFEGLSLSAVVFTDVERDGMRTGLNVEATWALARSTSFPVIASGGVSSLEDILRISAVERDGVVGVIVGRALYTGDLELEAAIRAAKKGPHA